MALSITETKQAKEALKTRSMYDNYDNLIAVVKYDNNQKVDYVLKTKHNLAGESLQTQRLNQLQVDIVEPAANITGDSALLKARIYKNDNSKVYETGFIFWKGNATDSVINKPGVGDVFVIPNIFKGNFSKQLTDLEDTTTYNYRAYVRHEYGINYSKAAQFSTIDFTSIFQIIGDKFSGPKNLTVNLEAINAGFGPYTYAWNMTGGPIGFDYAVDSINVPFSGVGYTPQTSNFIIDTVTMSPTGAGYDTQAALNVLVNGKQTSGLIPVFGRNLLTNTFGITSITIPVPLSGFQTSTLEITFSSANAQTITEIASGLGAGRSYTTTRENIVLIDGVYQSSLQVQTFQDEDTGIYGVSGVNFTIGPLTGYKTSSRTFQLSSNGPVNQLATISLNTSFDVLADYTTRTITHTYSAVGSQTPIVYALFGDQIQKTASRIVRVTASTNFTPQWSNVLAAYGTNIAAAYDFRNFVGVSQTANLNEYPLALWDFEPSSVGPLGEQNTSSVLIDKIDSFRDSIGGYLFIGGYVPYGSVAPHPIFGYPVAQLDYSKFFGPGVTPGTRAIRFDSSLIPTFNNTGIQATQYLSNTYPLYCFNLRQPFTVSMWVNMEKFDNPGTKLFTVRTFNGNEYSITQSPTALNIFRNVYLSDTLAGYRAAGTGGPWPEPVAGYYNGLPVLSTTDPAKMLTPKTWHHLVVTRSPQHTYKYYLDGNLEGTATTILSPVTDPTTQIGNNWNTAGIGGYNGFDGIGNYSFFGGYCTVSIGDTINNPSSRITAPSGRIDSVSIWGKELTEDEVVLLYNGGENTDEYGYLAPVVGPKLWLGGLVGVHPFSNFGDIRTRPFTTGDNLWDNVSLRIKFDGDAGDTNFVDTSLNTIRLSGNGGVVISNSVKKYGTGSGDFRNGCLQTPTSAMHAWFGLEDFTVEWWEYLVGNEYFYPIMFFGGTGHQTPGLFGYQPAVPAFGLYYRPIGVGGYTVANGLTITHGFQEYNIVPTGLSTNLAGYRNQWVHNAVQRRRFSPEGYGGNTTWTWYRNGSVAGYVNGIPGVNTYIDNIGGYFKSNVGRDGSGLIGGGDLGGYWNDYTTVRRFTLSGYLDDIRITKGVARYTNSFVPPLTASSKQYGDILGTQFNIGGYGIGGYGAYATAKDVTYGIGGYTRETISVTYPHTLVFVGDVNGITTNQSIYQSLQPTLRSQPQNSQTIQSLSRIFQGVVPQNGLANFSTAIAGYTIPGNAYRSSYLPFPIAGYSEWMYIAYSFLGPNNANNIRYYLKTPSISGTGIVAGYSSVSNFNGIPSFGVGGYTLGMSMFAENNIIGNVRLGMFMNRGFPEFSDMLSLYQTITAGPANDIKL